MPHEFDGKKYEHASSHQKEWGERLIKELNLQETEHILDLGCGDGALTLQLSRLVPKGRVVGIDASKGMIETARQKESANLTFLLMDIDDLDFAEQFDVVFSNATLHWVKDHTRLLGNVKRALRPSGIVRFNFAGEGNCAYFFKVIRESMEATRFSGYFTMFEWPWYMPPVEEYKVLAEGCGFSSIQVWGENADRFFADAEALIQWIDQPSIVPFITCVAEEDKVTFREFVVRRMIKETVQPDGTYFETFRRINVLARK